MLTVALADSSATTSSDSSSASSSDDSSSAKGSDSSSTSSNSDTSSATKSSDGSSANSSSADSSAAKSSDSSSADSSDASSAAKGSDSSAAKSSSASSSDQSSANSVSSASVTSSSADSLTNRSGYDGSSGSTNTSTASSLASSLASVNSSAAQISAWLSEMSSASSAVSSYSAYVQSSGAWIDSASAMSNNVSVFTSAYTAISSYNSQGSSASSQAGSYSKKITDSNASDYQSDVDSLVSVNSSYYSAVQSASIAASNAEIALNSQYSATSSAYANADNAGQNAGTTTNTTVNVTTAAQFDAAVQNKNVYHVNVLNNISLSGIYGDTYITKTVVKNTSGKDFVVNGLQKDGSTWSTINYLGASYNVTNVNSVTFENQNAYGISGFGLTTDDGSGNSYGSTQPVYFNNVNYTGGQLVDVVKAPVYVQNQLTVHSVNSYTVPDISGDTATHSAQGGSDKNQRNMQAGSLTVLSGAKCYGYTSDGNVNVYGDVDINSGDTTNALYVASGANMYIDGGRVNVNINQTPSAYPVDVEGTLTVQNNAQFNVIAKNIGNYGNIMTYVGGTMTSQTGSLIHISLNNDTGMGQPYLLQMGDKSTVNVINQGNLQIDSDGTSNPVLLQVGSGVSVNINNPGKTVVFDLDTSYTDPAQKTSQGNITNSPFNAYSVSVNNNGNVKGAYYAIQIPKSGTITYYNAQSKSFQSLPTVNASDSNSTANSKIISFSASPSANFDGPLTLQKYGTDQYLVSGKLTINNISNVPDDLTSQPIYMNISVNGNQQLKDCGVVDDPKTDADGDGNTYTYKIPVTIDKSNG